MGLSSEFPHSFENEFVPDRFTRFQPALASDWASKEVSLLTFQFFRFVKALWQVGKQELLEFLGRSSEQDSISSLLVPDGGWILLQVDFQPSLSFMPTTWGETRQLQRRLNLEDSDEGVNRDQMTQVKIILRTVGFGRKQIQKHHSFHLHEVDHEFPFPTS